MPTAHDDEPFYFPAEGELVDVTITGARVASRGDYSYQMLIPDAEGVHDRDVPPFYFWLPADTPQVRFSRSVPADGEPQPGELWADARGLEHFAMLHSSGVHLVGADGMAWPWQRVHRGEHGPVRRVRPARVAEPERKPS